MNGHGTGALGRWEGDLMRCTGAGEVEGGGDRSGIGGMGGGYHVLCDICWRACGEPPTTLTAS